MARGGEGRLDNPRKKGKFGDASLRDKILARRGAGEEEQEELLAALRKKARPPEKPVANAPPAEPARPPEPGVNPETAAAAPNPTPDTSGTTSSGTDAAAPVTPTAPGKAPRKTPAKKRVAKRPRALPVPPADADEALAAAVLTSSSPAPDVVPASSDAGLSDSVPGPTPTGPDVTDPDAKTPDKKTSPERTERGVRAEREAIKKELKRIKDIEGRVKREGYDPARLGDLETRATAARTRAEIEEIRRSVDDAGRESAQLCRRASRRTVGKISTGPRMPIKGTDGFCWPGPDGTVYIVRSYGPYAQIQPGGEVNIGTRKDPKWMKWSDGDWAPIDVKSGDRERTERGVSDDVIPEEEDFAPESPRPRAEPRPASYDVPPPPPPMTPPQELPGRHQLVLGNMAEAVDDMSRDIADRRMTASHDSMKGLRNLPAKIWKHNLFHAYYRQKEFNKAKKEILEAKNLFAAETNDKTAHDNLVRSLLNRFGSELGDEMVHKLQGEWRKTKDDPAFVQRDREVKELLVKMVNGSFATPADFKAERDRVIAAATGLDMKQAQAEVYHFDNLMQVAEQLKQGMAHGRALAMADLDTLDIVFGKAKTGVRTEAQLNSVERSMKWLESHGATRWVNESTLGLAVAGVYSVASLASKKFASSKLAAIGSFGATAGFGAFLAGARESKRLEEERRQHAREMAMGGGFRPEQAPRRKEMEKFRYLTERSNDLKQRLSERMANISTPEGYQQAIVALADIETRVSLSDQKSIDLLSYSSAYTIEQERYELDVARAQAKVTLRRTLAANPGLSSVPGARGTPNFDALLSSACASRQTDMFHGSEGIEKKNELFRAMKKRRVAAKALAGLGVGLGVGLIAQEALAAVSPTQEGLVDGIMHGHHAGAPVTALERLRLLLQGHEPGQGLPLVDQVGPDGTGHFMVPQGMQLLPTGANNAELLRADGSSIPLHFDHGHLDANSLAALHNAGIDATPGTPQVGPPTTVATRFIPNQEFMQQHPELFHHIHRDMWYDNDTPAPVFDKNELQTHWGGIHGTGIDDHGNYVMNIGRMTPGGSYHSQLSVNAQEAMKSGKLKMLLSMSRETQSQVVEVPIGADGQIHIDPHSAIGHLFFKNENGHAVFRGKFAEVAETMGTDRQTGVEHFRILSTVVGHGVTGLEEDIKKAGEVPVTILQGVRSDYDFLPPPFIPIWGRTPLESMADGIPPRARPEVVPPLYGYYGANSAETIMRDFERRGVQRDPYSVVERNGKKVFLDKAGRPVERSVDRERSEIERYMEGQEESYRNELRSLNGSLPPMDERCRVAINIPARFEARNLANLLEQYSKQTDEKGNPLDPRMFEINILVNRKRSESPDDSIAVVNRWKEEHPNVRVNVIDVAFDDARARVGLARKYLTDLTLMRSTDRSRQAGSLYIESEDADVVSVDRRVVWKLTNDFDNEPGLDVLRGVQDRQPELMMRNDLLFFSRRLWDLMEVLARSQHYRPENSQASDFVWNRVISGGWNTAYTAEAYTKIGGYDQGKVIGEDMDIGQKISVLRGQERDGVFVPNTQTAQASGLRSNSSPRRFIDALARGIGAYDDFENQTVKGESIDDLLGRISKYERVSPDQLDRYRQEVTVLSDFVSTFFGGKNEQWRELTSRTLWYMGLRPGRDFEIAGGTVELKPQAMETIATLMETYRTKERWRLGYQRQNSAIEEV